MKVLVLGGQRFLGRALVSLMHKDGYFVSLLQKNPYTDEKLQGVEYLQADVLKKEELQNLKPGESWDFVFDFSTQNPVAMNQIIEVLGSRFKKYFYFSNILVYPYGQNLHEEQFDPVHFELPSDLKSLTSVDAMRGVEALIAQKLSKRFVIIRMPFVFGEKDPSLKLQKLIRKVVGRESVYFPNLEARFSVITVDEAVKSIMKLCLTPFSGVVNLASSSTVRVGLFLKWIENYSYVTVMISAKPTVEATTPFSLEKDLYFDVGLLKKLGISIPNLSGFIEEQIKKECQNLLDESL